MSRCFANLWRNDIAFKCLNSEIRHKRNSDDSSDDSSFIQTEKESLTNKTQPPISPPWTYLSQSSNIITSPPSTPQGNLKEDLGNNNTVARRPITVEDINRKRRASKSPTTVFIDHRSDGPAKTPADASKGDLVNMSPSSSAVAM